MHCPEAVLETRVLSRRIDPAGALKLLNAPQPLHPGVVDKVFLGCFVRPVMVAHGEGYADFGGAKKLKAAQELVTLRYVDNRGAATETYPLNPNGSPQGITGLTTPDGRFSIMMPHPERVFRAVQHSWHPSDWQENGAWLKMFQNARRWVG